MSKANSTTMPTHQPQATTMNGIPLKDTFRSAYSPKQRHSITFISPGRTKQSFKDECDINTIMGRYLKSGSLEHVNRALPQFTDLEGVDYQQAMLAVAESKSLFNQLPSDIRFRFGNDPARFLDFVHDEGNKQEMARMGLLTPEAASLALQATPAAPPPPATQSTPVSATPQTSPSATNPAT